MNISGMIGKLKAKGREEQSYEAQVEAEKLSALKKERLRVEGQKKFFDLKNREVARIAEAKKAVRKERLQNSLFGKAARAAKTVKKAAKGSQVKKATHDFVPEKVGVSRASQKKRHPWFKD